MADRIGTPEQSWAAVDGYIEERLLQPGASREAVLAANNAAEGDGFLLAVVTS